MAYALPFQVGDAADAAMGEQLVAAGMHAGDDGDRQLAIDRDDVRERQVRLEIELAVPEVFQLPSDARVDVADIGKPVGAQQGLADILQGETDDRQPAEPRKMERMCRPRSRPEPRAAPSRPRQSSIASLPD